MNNLDSYESVNFSTNEKKEAEMKYTFEETNNQLSGLKKGMDTQEMKDMWNDQEDHEEGYISFEDYLGEPTNEDVGSYTPELDEQQEREDMFV